MQRVLIDYVGTVRGLRSYLPAAMNPGKVVSLDAHRQKKKATPARVTFDVRPGEAFALSRKRPYIKKGLVYDT